MFVRLLKHILILSLLLFSVFSFSETNSKEKDLPATQRFTSNLKNISEAYPHMWISYNYKTQYPDYVTTGADLIKVNLEILETSIQVALAAGEDPQNLALDYNRYEIGDSRVTDFFIRISKQYHIGELVIYTDGNTFGEYAFSDEDTSYASDFHNAKKFTFKTNPEAQAIQKLIQAGFVLCDSQTQYKELTTKGIKKIIIAQGIYNHKKVSEIPIEHQKNASIVSLNKDGSIKKAIVGVKSTSNDTLPPNVQFDRDNNVVTFSRYNRLLEVKEPNLINYMRVQSLALRDSLGNGLQIKDTKSPTPPEIIFSSTKEFIRAYHTDGQYNPNNEQAKLMQWAIDNPEQIQISHLLSNQFVNTFKPGLQSLRALKAKYPHFTYDGLFDLHFASTYGFGFAGALGGFAVFRPMGPPIYPFGSQLRDGFNISVYMRPLDGVNIETQDGAPTNVVLDHDKTNIWTAKIFGDDYKVIFWGSLNYSSHKDNAEYQDIDYARPDSKLALAFEESIHKFIDNETKARFVWPIKEAVTRIAIASLIGHTEFEVSREFIDEIIRIYEKPNAQAEDFKNASDRILELAQTPTSLKKKPDLNNIKLKLDKLSQLLSWYNGKYHSNFGFSIRQLVNIIIPLIHEQIPAIQKKMAIELMVYDSKLSSDEINQKMKTVWTELKKLNFVSEAYPESYTEAESTLIDEKKTSALSKEISSHKFAQTKTDTSVLPNELNDHFYVLDFDDNFLVTKSRIYVRSKKDANQEVGVSTAKWASVKNQLGKYGFWKNYEIFDKSMREFEPGQLLSLLPVKNGKLKLSDKIKGPSFLAFQNACKSKDSAKLVYFNTARRSPDDIDKVLDLLVESGEILNRPPKENILFGANTPQKKQENLLKVLSKAEAVSITSGTKYILTPDGQNHKPLHTVGYSDDDYENIRGVVSAMTEIERKQSYPHIKLTVFYTGEQIYPEYGKAPVPKQTLVITSNGTRPQTAEEVYEYAPIFYQNFKVTTESLNKCKALF